GAGKAAPALWHRISQTSKTSAITTIGGTIFAGSSFKSRSQRLVFGNRGASGSTLASVCTATALAVLTAGLFIQISWRKRTGRPLPERPRGGSDFPALAGETLEIGRRVFGIEDFPVEESFLAARLRSGDVGHAELLRGFAPEILAVHFSDQRLRVEIRFEFSPANVLGEKPEIVALERIRGVIRPVAHHLRMLFDDFSGAVVEFSFHAVDDVVKGRVHPLLLAHDGRKLFRVRGIFAPLLGFHDRHEKRLRRRRILVDVGGAQREGLFGVVVPKLSGRDRCVAD